jgi:hypothetical protein
MVIDSVGTDNKVSGDLGVGEALGYQAQYLDLAGGQTVGIGNCRFYWRE